MVHSTGVRAAGGGLRAGVVGPGVWGRGGRAAVLREVLAASMVPLAESCGIRSPFLPAG